MEEVEYIEIPEIQECLYTTLGVEKEANTKEIKDAYIEIAKVFHPDRCPEALVSSDELT